MKSIESDFSSGVSSASAKILKSKSESCSELVNFGVSKRNKNFSLSKIITGAIVSHNKNKIIIENCDHKLKGMFFIPNDALDEFWAIKPNKKILERQRKIAKRFEIGK